MTTKVRTRYGPVWRSAELYVGAREKDVHIPHSVLLRNGWDQAIITAASEIIDGHETRSNRDHLKNCSCATAGKPLRHDAALVSVACDRCSVTPRNHADRVGALPTKFKTGHGRVMAGSELAAMRGKLMLHAL